MALLILGRIVSIGGETLQSSHSHTYTSLSLYLFRPPSGKALWLVSLFIIIQVDNIFLPNTSNGDRNKMFFV
jgi:hypothetical protein